MHPKCCGKTNVLGASVQTEEEIERSHVLSSISHVLFEDELIVILG